MTKETFIKTWFEDYNDITKELMREDLDKVIEKYNEPETFNTEMQKLTDLENELMKKYIVQLEKQLKQVGYIFIFIAILESLRVIHSLIN